MKRTRARLCPAERALIIILVPIFLIISSSVYPAFMSGIENKEMQIVSKVMARSNEKNIDTSGNHADMQISSKVISTFSSPTLIEPYFSASKYQPDDKFTAAAINPGDAVHVVWSDDSIPDQGSPDIFYKRDGADFDPSTMILDPGFINQGNSELPTIAISGNNVHVVWRSDISGSQKIFYIRSTDGGATFGPRITLSDGDFRSSQPAIAISGNNVHVVWEDGPFAANKDIFYRRSTDEGATFTEPTKNLSNNAGNSINPVIAAVGNNVHVAWQDDSIVDNEILYRRSINGGSTFPNIIRNISNNGGESEFPAIAAIGNIVHFVWADITPGNFDILYRRSTDGGASTFDPTKNLSDSIGSSFFPAIAVSDNNVHVVWNEDQTPFNRDIVHRRSLDSGATFPNIIKNLSESNGDSFSSAIATIGNNVYVVWEDVTTGNSEILYAESTDNGITFDPMLSNLSTNIATSESPAIAIS